MTATTPETIHEWLASVPVPMDEEAARHQPLDIVVLARTLNPDGEIRLLSFSSNTLAPWDEIGMLTVRRHQRLVDIENRG